jgi:hypothetical protein
MMKRGAFAGGAENRRVDVTSREDPLELYRRDVERHLGDRLVLLQEETFERFFDHVIASFNRGLPAAECARTWLRPLSS